MLDRLLLKYATRDEIELLDRGTGGIAEIRKTIAAYEETSPLFGLLKYRGRNVLVKYVPEGVSRLITVRLAVHLNAVVERLSPETVFEIETAKELGDGALSAACSLHTASGSTSFSTSSLRQRRLLEIAEVEEDNNKQLIVQEEDTAVENIRTEVDEHTEQPAAVEVHDDAPTAADLLALAASIQADDAERAADADLTLVPTISVEPDNSRRSTNSERYSIQSTRSDLTTYNSYTSSGRLKVKLGPRPSLDSAPQGQTSASVSSRPVSSLPPGLKLLSRSKKQKGTTIPEHSVPNQTLLSPTMEGVAITIMDDAGRPTSMDRRNSSSGASIRSTLSTASISSKMSSTSPEQAKLMKALELRKKKLAAAAEEEARQKTLEESHKVIEVDPAQIPLPNDDDVEEPTVATEFASTAQSSIPSSPLDTIAPTTESTRASSIWESTAVTVNEDASAATVLQPENDNAMPSTTQTLSTIDDTLNESEPSRKEATPNNDIKTNESGDALEKSAISDNCQSSARSPTEDKATNTETQSTPSEKESEVAIAPEPVTTSSTPELLINGTKASAESSQLAPPKADIRPEATILSLQNVNIPSYEDTFAVVGPKVLREIQHAPMMSAKREIKIPESKFCVQKENERPPLVNITESTNGAQQDLSPQKRRVLVAPIITDAKLNQKSRPNSTVDLLNDDDLMDELQFATVQEAKPISLPKSPGRALFPQDIKRVPSRDRLSRTVSNPNELLNQANKQPQRPENPRSVSASAWLNRANQQQPTPLLKKVNLGGGIAQRIKDLEKLNTTQGSGRPPSQPSSAVCTAPSPAFFAVRKTNGGGSSIADRANSVTRNGPSSPSSTRASSPEQHFKGRGRSLSINRGDNNSNQPSSTLYPRPDSSSSRHFPTTSLRNVDYNSSDPRQAPLGTVADEVATASQQRGDSRSPLKNGKSGRRPSISSVKDLIGEARKSLSERRRSTATEDPSRPGTTHQNSASPIGSPLMSNDFGNRSPSILSDESPEKKGSRATRMLHRMSSSLSASKKTIAHAMSPTTVREEAEPAAAIGSEAVGSHASAVAAAALDAKAATVLEMGDVNVQFPDNLLWKRRAMRLDSQGYLILTQSQVGGEKSAAEKKYHLGEFLRPEVPDIDMEEMPNSVVLNRREGSGLQVACADRVGQGWVLQSEYYYLGR